MGPAPRRNSTTTAIKCLLSCAVFLAWFGALLVPGLTLVGVANAQEVYVWTDEQGNRHFGDQPPEQADVEVEQERYEIHNRDSGYPYTDPDLYKNQTETLTEKRKRERAAQLESDRQLRAAMAGPCQAARERLAMLQGPVSFYDDDGNEIKKTELDRQQEFRQLEKEIARRCR